MKSFGDDSVIIEKYISNEIKLKRNLGILNFKFLEISSKITFIYLKEIAVFRDVIKKLLRKLLVILTGI